MAGVDNIDMMTEINFDNWIIYKHIRDKSGNTSNSHITGQYSDVGNLVGDQNKQNLYRQYGVIDNVMRGPAQGYQDSEMIQLTSFWCNNYIHLTEQMEYVNTLWHLTPDNPRYHLRLALNSYITSSNPLNALAVNEQRNVRTGLLRSMDQLFREIPPTTHSFTVTRIFGTHPGPDYIPEGSLDNTDNHRFLSTTLSKTSSSGFFGNFVGAITDRSYHVKIVIPPDCKIIPIINYGKWTNRSTEPGFTAVATSSEFEILLPRYYRLYNIPDHFRCCNMGDACRYGVNCRYPHLIKKYFIQGTDEIISSCLATTLERLKIQNVPRFQFPYIAPYRQITLENINTNNPILIKNRTPFNLYSRNFRFASETETIKWQDTTFKPRVTPANQVPPQLQYKVLPHVNQRGVTTPDITDLFCLIPAEDLCPQYECYVSLQNGWYLLYYYTPGQYHLRLYHPRVLRNDGTQFQFNITTINHGGKPILKSKNSSKESNVDKSINIIKEHQDDVKEGSEASSEASSEAGSEADTQVHQTKVDTEFTPDYDAENLINEIGMNPKIPLYDKIHIILKMKEKLRNEKKKIVTILE